MRSIPAILALAASLLAPAAMAQTTPTGASAQSTPPSRPAAATPAGTAAPATPAKVPDPALLDINTATREQLVALPQIGPARADAIVKGRPYRAKTDLRKVLPANAYEAVEGLVVARRQ